MANMETFVFNKDESSSVIAIIGPMWKRPIDEKQEIGAGFNYDS